MAMLWLEVESLHLCFHLPILLFLFSLHVFFSSVSHKDIYWIGFRAHLDNLGWAYLRSSIQLHLAAKTLFQITSHWQVLGHILGEGGTIPLTQMGIMAIVSENYHAVSMK